MLVLKNFKKNIAISIKTKKNFVCKTAFPKIP